MILALRVGFVHALALVLWASLAGAALAQHAPESSARRTVQVFTFDDPSNPDPVPPNWKRAQDSPPASGAHSTPGLERPGFPAHNKAELDRTVSRSGDTSVRLPTLGGSTSLRLETGQVPVFADADYVIAAWVRTTELRHSRAFLVARLLDQRGQPIDGSESRSEPVISAGLWREVSVFIPGKFRDSAWLQIELQVLQPRQYEPEPAGALAAHKVWREDISGAAWFDDAGAYQVPRARIWTSAPNNIVVSPQEPTLTMMVRDLAGEPLGATVRVQDIDGKTVASLQTTVNPSARPSTWKPVLPGYGWYRARMDVAAGGTGGGGGGGEVPISTAEVWFIYQPRLGQARTGGSAARADAQRFGLVAEDVPESRLGVLAGVVEAAGTGFIVLPAFDAGSGLDGVPTLTQGRNELFTRLLDQGQDITLSIGRVPGSVAGALAIDADDALAMAERDLPVAVGARGAPGVFGESAAMRPWIDYLRPTLDVYGQRLARYQLGGIGDGRAMKRDPSGALTRFERAIMRLVPSPVLALPWRADREPPRVGRVAGGKPAGAEPAGTDPVFPAMAESRGAGGPLLGAVSLIYPAAMAAEEMESVARVWQGAAPDPAYPDRFVETTVVAERVGGTGGEGAGGREAVIESVKRCVHFWRAFGGAEAQAPAGSTGAARPARWGLRSAWTWPGGDVDGTGTAEGLWPAPELAAVRVLSERLSGRRVIGAMPAPPGVTAFILAGRGTARGAGGGGGGLERGCVVAWSESGGDTARIDLAVAGRTLTVVDPFGNERSVEAGGTGGEAGAQGAGPVVAVMLDRTPVFIEGVDPYLAMFAAGVRLEPSFIPATAAEHEHRLIVANPWPVRISGQLQIKEAVTDGSQGREWTVSPKGLIDFAIAPGASESIPVSLAFGRGQIAGRKDFLVIAKVTADRQYPALRLKAGVEVGLRTLEIAPEAQVGAGGQDVYVSVAVTNRDTRPRTLRLEAKAPGLAGQQQQISDLPPGQTITRRFVFKDSAKALSGKRIMVSLADAEAAERLNRAVSVP